MNGEFETYVGRQVTVTIVVTANRLFCWWRNVTSMLMKHRIRRENGRSRRDIVLVRRCQLLSSGFLGIENVIDLLFWWIMLRMMRVGWSIEWRRDRVACFVVVQMAGNGLVRINWRVWIGRIVFIDRRWMRIEIVALVMERDRIVVVMRLSIVIVGGGFLLVVFFRTKWR